MLESLVYVCVKKCMRVCEILLFRSLIYSLAHICSFVVARQFMLDIFCCLQTFSAAEITKRRVGEFLSRIKNRPRVVVCVCSPIVDPDHKRWLFVTRTKIGS